MLSEDGISAEGAPPRRAPLRVALFGCGRMGLQHLRAIASAGEAVVAGIADPALDRGALEGLLPPDAAVCADPAELLERARPDVVHVVTPPETHAALARLAIEAGCHVYVEKPFTPTRAEADMLLRLAAERRLSVCPGHQQLFEPPALRMLEALPAIGRVVHVDSYFSFRTVRRAITPVEQVKDVLPHAVYPVVEQLRAAGGGAPGAPIAVTGLDAHADGELRALVRLGHCTGSILVSLNARPIEQYQHVVGTNGSLRADYVTGSLVRLVGPGTGAGLLLTPYRSALQVLRGATAGFARRLLARQASYPGLREIVSRFHRSIRTGDAPPVGGASILETVALCERFGQALDRAEAEAEARARRRLEEARPAAVTAARPTVLVTGGTGLLGRRVARELREAGFPVRALARRLPRYAVRVAGVEYAAHDLARPLDARLTAGAGVIVHCAAETQGGQADHERNSVRATRHVLEAAARARAHVVHVSSLAVLKPAGAGAVLDEDSPVDGGHLGRGPYVWGKAESETLARRLGPELGVRVAVIRPGPLVDQQGFQAPGRLGRELGPVFVAVGRRGDPLPVCDVATAARVVRAYLQDFDSAPAVLNLVDTPVPTRGELAARLLASRPDLRVVWLPALVLRALSGPLKLAQRLALGRGRAVDVYAAFASEPYRTARAAAVIGRAGSAP
jgi:predicted dehydrogenase/nucleoside-diphosphate-sugar epimerase